MQRTAVAKTPEQLTYRTHKYLQHAATLAPADHADLLKLLFYQPGDSGRPPTTRCGTPPLVPPPSTKHDSDTPHAKATGTAHTRASMRAPQAPMPPHHRPSTGTANRQPPRAPSAFANSYHLRPYFDRSAGICQVRWVHLARQFIALPRSWLWLRMYISVSREARSHVPRMWGLSSSSSLVYMSGRGLCVGGGGVVGREEGVGAVYHSGAGWCVVEGAGEGVVYVVHEGHVRGGGWLLVVGGGDVARDVVPEVAQRADPVNQRPRFPPHGVVWGGAGWGVVHVGLMVAGAALGIYPPRLAVSDKVSLPIDGGYPDSVPFGGPALAVSGGKRGPVVLGNVEEGVEEEV